MHELASMLRYTHNDRVVLLSALCDVITVPSHQKQNKELGISEGNYEEFYI